MEQIKPEESSTSLFDLPVSKGAKIARVIMIATLNVALLGGGVALIIEYFNKRAQVLTDDPSIQEADDTHTVSDPNPAPPEGATGSPLPVLVGTSKKESARKPVSAKAKAPGTARSKSPAKVRVESPDPAASRRDASSPPVSPAVAPAPATLPATPSDEGETEQDKVARVRFLAGQIGLVVRRHQGPLKRCYQRASKTTTPKDPIEGRISLKFSLQPDGRATNVKVISNSLGAPVVAQCLVGLVEGWTFPSSGSEALEFVWPFEFMAPE